MSFLPLRLPSLSSRWWVCLVLALYCAFLRCEAFDTSCISRSPYSLWSKKTLRSWHPVPMSSFVSVGDLTMKRTTTVALSMNFLKDMLAGAFENDSSLNQDKSKDQLEGPNSVIDDDQGPFSSLLSSSSSSSSPSELTDIQRAWREQMKNNRSNGSGTRAGSVQVDMMENTNFAIDLYLVGVPSRDPSNDLYGSRTNISSRDRNVGLDVPDEPSLSSLRIKLLPDGICECEESAFTTGPSVLGEWKLDPEGKQLRFSLDVLGYSRTIQTKGSIQKIYWSKEEERTSATSTSYTIEPGWVYGDVMVGYGKNPGTIMFKSDGILRVEKTTGLLGAGSTLIPCGKFRGKQLFDA